MLHSLDAERLLLGGLMDEPERLAEVAAEVSAGDFFAEPHRAIFDAIAGCVDAGVPVEPLTVATDAGVGFAVVGTLMNESLGAFNAVHYAKIIRDFSQRRAVLRVTGEARQALESTPAVEVAARLAGELEQISAQSNGGGKSWKEVLMAGVEAIEQAQARRAAGGIVGAPWGIPAIDQRIGGVCPGRLIVVAARPSVGKTAVTMHGALYAAFRGHGVGICSLEMDYDEIALRSFAREYQVNFTRLLHGAKQEADDLAHKVAEKPITDFKIFTDCDTYDIHGIVARITEWKRKHGIAYAIVDHIGIIDGGPDGKHMERLAYYSRTLKKLAKKLGIGIVLVSQLNRANEKEQRRPRLSDLRECGEIEQDADIVMMLHQEEQVIGSPDVRVHIGFEKNRCGRKGWLSDTERVVFVGATQTFKQLAHMEAVA